jgi:hypothetical protein
VTSSCRKVCCRSAADVPDEPFGPIVSFIVGDVLLPLLPIVVLDELK